MVGFKSQSRLEEAYGEGWEGEACEKALSRRSECEKSEIDLTKLFSQGPAAPKTAGEAVDT